MNHRNNGEADIETEGFRDTTRMVNGEGDSQTEGLQGNDAAGCNAAGYKA